jgi:hypothetical protein
MHYRLMTYSDLKAQKNANYTISNFSQLKIGHEQKINRCLSKSPVQEFIDENYNEEVAQSNRLVAESMFLPEKDIPKTMSNNAMFGKYTGMRLSGEYKNNANELDSNIKRLRDFKSPF